MAEVLKSYDQFDTDELAEGLRSAAINAAPILRRRRFNGVLARYGDTLDIAKANVEIGQRNTAKGKLAHFAVLNSGGGIIGAASIFPNFPLEKVRLPIRARLLPSFLTRDFPHASPNLSAWEATVSKEHLAMTYRDLVGQVDRFIPASGIRNIPWAIEPRTSPAYIHNAISTSGLQTVHTGRYDDKEGGLLVPKSTLYAATSDWVTSFGHLGELETGDWHGSTDEIMSRNPRG